MNKETPKIFSVFVYDADGWSYRNEKGIPSKFVAHHRLDEDELIKLFIENNAFDRWDELIVICNGYLLTGNVSCGKLDYDVNESYYKQYLLEYYDSLVIKIYGLIKKERERIEKEKQELEQRKLQQIREEQEKILIRNEELEYQQYIALKKKYESI